MSSPLTTHVLDTARGVPAQGVPIELETLKGGAWTPLSKGTTNADGRCPDLLAPGALKRGTYKLRFDTKAYLGVGCFYPYAEIVFEVLEERHHHIPLLLAPFGYTTYRGS
jgi:5-hydroxyisourate hydrolase